MYNRYVPQSDGTYQRNRVPDAPQGQRAPGRQAYPPRQGQAQPSTPQPKQPDPSPIQPPPQPEPQPEHRTQQPPFRDPPNNQNAGTFFSRLLPKNMESGDLLMLLILLLLLSDGDEDAPPALLTIALYFLLKSG